MFWDAFWCIFCLFTALPISDCSNADIGYTMAPESRESNALLLTASAHSDPATSPTSPSPGALLSPLKCDILSCRSVFVHRDMLWGCAVAHHTGLVKFKTKPKQTKKKVMKGQFYHAGSPLTESLPEE